MGIVSIIIKESKRQGLSLPRLCKDANVNYQTVWRSIKYGNKLKSDTIDNLLWVLDRPLVFVDKSVKELIEQLNQNKDE
jgi:hypothetical protein